MCNIVATSNPKPGESVVVDNKTYDLLKEKGCFLYAKPSVGEPNIHIYFTKEKCVVATKAPISSLRNIGRRNQAYKEFELQEKKVLIWGQEFLRIGEETWVGDCMNIFIEHQETGAKAIITVGFTSLILESAIAA